jgi:hypothetical protein
VPNHGEAGADAFFEMELFAVRTCPFIGAPRKDMLERCSSGRDRERVLPRRATDCDLLTGSSETSYGACEASKRSATSLNP